MSNLASWKPKPAIPPGNLKAHGGNKESKSAFAGVRYQLNEQLEVLGVIDYDLDTDKDEDEISFQIHADYLIAPSLTEGAGVRPVDDSDVLSLNLRKYLF